MLHVTIHGNPASYSTADGWRCNDGLAERYLRSLCATERTPLSEEQALALAVREYGRAVVLLEPDTPDGPHDDDSHASPASRVLDTPLTELELPPPDAGRTQRISSFLGSRSAKRPT